MFYVVVGCSEMWRVKETKKMEVVDTASSETVVTCSGVVRLVLCLRAMVRF